MVTLRHTVVSALVLIFANGVHTHAIYRNEEPLIAAAPARRHLSPRLAAPTQAAAASIFARQGATDVDTPDTDAGTTGAGTTGAGTTGAGTTGAGTTGAGAPGAAAPGAAAPSAAAPGVGSSDDAKQQEIQQKQQEADQLRQQLDQQKADNDNNLNSVSQSFSQRLNSQSQQASQSIQQLQQTIQSVQQALVSVQSQVQDAGRSADSAISSVESAASQSIESAKQSALAANAPASCAAQATVTVQGSNAAASLAPAAAAVQTVTSTQITTVTATVRISVMSMPADEAGNAAGAAAELPVATCIVPGVVTPQQAEVDMLGTCTTTGKALAIVGLIMGGIGVCALAFVVTVLCRRRRQKSLNHGDPMMDGMGGGMGGGMGMSRGMGGGGGKVNDGSSTATSASSFLKQMKGPSLFERMRPAFLDRLPRFGMPSLPALSSGRSTPTGLGGGAGNRSPPPSRGGGLPSNPRPASPNDGGAKSTGGKIGKKAPSKDAISKPTRLSMWPNFFRRGSDRLSFKDQGGAQQLPMSQANKVTPLRPRRDTDMTSPDANDMEDADDFANTLASGASSSTNPAANPRLGMGIGAMRGAVNMANPLSRSPPQAAPAPIKAAFEREREPRGPPPAASAGASAALAAETQGARHSRLGSSAAMWTKFNTVMEAEAERSPAVNAPKGLNIRGERHNRTLSEIPAEDRTDSVVQEYDYMVREYHDYVSLSTKNRLGLGNNSANNTINSVNSSQRPMSPPEESAPRRLRDRRLQNFSRNSGNDEAAR